jgi:hypothetical protein
MGKADATHHPDTAGAIVPPPVIFLAALIAGLIAQMLRGSAPG